MQLLANENFPRIVVEALRDHGHDVLWIRTVMPGAKDQEILERAQKDNRVLVTQDKDFGELAFQSQLPSTCGIILFRLAFPSPEAAVNRIVTALESRADWSGHFAVVEESRIRFRSLPGSSP